MYRAILILSVAMLASAQTSKTLDVYVVDVEGGNATLFVTPAHESLLIDTGNATQVWSDRLATEWERAAFDNNDLAIRLTQHLRAARVRNEETVVVGETAILMAQRRGAQTFRRYRAQQVPRTELLPGLNRRDVGAAGNGDL
jgi:photosystem II stability/assembly factor-like uncharacterized protein